MVMPASLRMGLCSCFGRRGPSDVLDEQLNDRPYMMAVTRLSRQQPFAKGPFSREASQPRPPFALLRMSTSLEQQEEQVMTASTSTLLVALLGEEEGRVGLGAERDGTTLAPTTASCMPAGTQPPSAHPGAAATAAPLAPSTPSDPGTYCSPERPQQGTALSGKLALDWADGQRPLCKRHRCATSSESLTGGFQAGYRSGPVSLHCQWYGLGSTHQLQPLRKGAWYAAS